MSTTLEASINREVVGLNRMLMSERDDEPEYEVAWDRLKNLLREAGYWSEQTREHRYEEV